MKLFFNNKLELEDFVRYNLDGELHKKFLNKNLTKEDLSELFELVSELARDNEVYGKENWL